MIKKAIFISARCSSTRLPNKVLLDINGTTAIDYLVNNLKNSKFAEEIVICTTDSIADDTINEKADKLNVKCFRGNEEDKLVRWKGACEKFNIEMFAECGADDMFCDHELVDLVFKKYDQGLYDFIDGKDLYNDVYGITRNLLEGLCETKNSIIETDQLAAFVRDLNFSYAKLKVNKKFHKKYRLTLDYEEDFLFFQKVLETTGNNASYSDIILLLDKNPEIATINWCREQKWKDNQKNNLKGR